MLWFGAGLAMFLVGMLWMRQGVEQAQSDALRRTLARATGGRLQAFAAGVLVTLVIQSSSAATILVSGLVGAGALEFEAAVYGILGANVGTTVTAQLIRLTDAGGGGWLCKLFGAQSLAPSLWILSGVLLVLFRGKKARAAGTTLAGLGLLFTGLLTMQQSLAPLLASPRLLAALRAALGGPLTGFVTGFAVAVAVQSSSAAVGLLQMLCAAGVPMTFGQVYPVLLGIGIGGALATALLGQLGAVGKAGKTAASFFWINLLGALVNTGTICLVRMFGPWAALWRMPMDVGTIANVHFLFRASAAICLFPALGILCRILDEPRKTSFFTKSSRKIRHFRVE